MIRFRKFNVEKCPQQQTNWEEAASRLNCSLDQHGHNTYHCVANQDKSSLVEFCYDRLIGRFPKDNCVHLSSTGYLHTENCRRILPGCPQKSYLSNEIFKFPECLNINTIDRCYVSDPTCPNLSSDATVLPSSLYTTDYSTNELSFINSTAPIFTADNEYGFGIGVGISCVFILTCILLFFVIRRQIEKKDRRDSYLIDEPPPDAKSDVCFMSESLLSVQGVAYKTNKERFILTGLLCMDHFQLDLHEEDHILKLENLVQKSSFGIRNLTKQEIIEACKTLEKDNYVLINQCSIVTFTSEQVQDEAFFYLWEAYTLADALTELNSDAVIKYIRTLNYKPQQNERCIRIESVWNEHLIKRLREDILTHPTIQDEAIHEQVSCILKIPEEILKWDFTYRQRYSEYLKRGSVITYHACVMIVGCAGAGKTTFIARLRKKFFKKVRITTTVGLKVHHNIFIVDEINCKLDVMKNNKYLFITDTSRTISSAKVHEVHSIMQEEDIEKKGENEPLLAGKQDYNAAIPLMQEEYNGNKVVSVLDFAGQSAYFACHQVYLSQRAPYCLLVDMSKDLDAVVDLESHEYKNTIFEMWKYRDFFVFWLKSIDTYCNIRGKEVGKNTSVILIATHCEGKSQQDIENFFDDLKACLPKGSELQLYMRPEMYRALSFDHFDCSKDVQIEEVERLIVETIKNHDLWGRRIPATWAVFENYVLERKHNTKIITLDELKEETIGLPKDIKELNSLLRFFHENGYILYFDEEGLRETIVLDVQWFVDAYKHIITDIAHVGIKDRQRRDFLWYMKSGHLTEDLLFTIWNPAFIPNKERILTFMQRLGLLAICCNQDETRWYYIPSMNKIAMSENDKAKLHSAQSKTSVLSFKFEFIPIFVFYRLVVTCIGNYGYLRNENERYLYNNIAIFRHRKHSFGISVTENSIQIQIFRQSVKGNKRSLLKLDTKVTLEIRRTIEAMLKDLTQTFHRNLKYAPGYMCRMGDLCEIKPNDSFVEESMFQNEKEFKCPHHTFGESTHLLKATHFLKYWTMEFK